MKRSLPRRVLIVGSSALKIGEAGEFDYSGSQAIKALKEEGIETLVLNPNIATIQTSEALADEIFFLPVTPESVRQVIESHKPDGILLAFGGQTALNCGLAMDESGVLEAMGVEVLGTPLKTIRDTEDRARFVERLGEIGVLSARSHAVGDVEAALEAAESLSYPVMVRIAFALGGLGSGVCRTPEELRERASQAFAHTTQILVEEYLGGWKEIEYEVVRDRFDNCITVCNMENFDPMGIHTGESIVVAPSQTLTNEDYHLLRAVSIRVIRHLGVIGECNIQFAYDPNSLQYRVIEVNARLSRSSALASKATGYPLAFVAAKLALGYGLFELPNAMTGVTTAFFEPALDYIVVKMPRWDLTKFSRVSKVIGSGMKSVGEVMAIGVTFEEALQKAIRMIDNGRLGVLDGEPLPEGYDLDRALTQPTDERIFAVGHALRRPGGLEHVHALTKIDRWFLSKIERLVHLEVRLKAAETLDAGLMGDLKRAGFSDKQIATLSDRDEADVRTLRYSQGIHPALRKIDTLAGEFPARSNYLYLSYHGTQDDLTEVPDNLFLILGSGPYRIGSSVEFDWCCVNASQVIRELGHTSAILNCNPETVSTDFDSSDVLIFDVMDLETVLELNLKLSPRGILVSVGGQAPNSLAPKLHALGVPIMGTSPTDIDRAENRFIFSALLDSMGVDQPAWSEVSDPESAQAFAEKVGFPVLVRPSYVLSGAAMAVASTREELVAYLARATLVSPEHPVVLSRFIENAKELEFDAVAQHGVITSFAISEHVENAGVHSGDATLVTPPQRTYLETVRQIRRIGSQIASALNIHGPFNIQFIAQHNLVKVIECNLRASRSFPFISKVLRHNFIAEAVRVMLGGAISPLKDPYMGYDYVGVKAPQFSFTRLEGADPTTGVEMSSTGEVGCLGRTFHEAFLKALLSVGYTLDFKTMLISSGPTRSKLELLEATRKFVALGVKVFATPGTAAFMAEHLPVETLAWPLDGVEPNALTAIKSRQIGLVINIPKDYRSEELNNDYLIRRAAVDYGVPLITNSQIGWQLAEALASRERSPLRPEPLSAYIPTPPWSHPATDPRGAAPLPQSKGPKRPLDS